MNGILYLSLQTIQMKKLLTVTLVGILAACGSGSSASTTDSTAVKTDSSMTAHDSTNSMADSTKQMTDSMKMDSTKK
jgi:ABC-type glycerol-3-phosphate transport system substrate-binding protein